MELTEEQRTIIGHRGGHARVSAVAGSGKTTTMVARLGELLQQGTAADKIMVLMFNRSARDSFDARMQAQFGNSGLILPEIRTFHSLGLRLVNSFTKRKALPLYRLVSQEFVLEQLARQSAMEVWRELEGKREYLPQEYIEFFLSFIDLVKGSVDNADALYRSLRLDKKFSFLVPAFTLFEERRRASKIRFYADLLYEPLQAMQQDPVLAQWVGNRVDHIIVDEYQDINECQQELLKIVAGERAEVMVVGDVDQCIYEWRGAKPAYINRRFAEDFPKPVNYQLSHTFRYGHSLSLAANYLIANNRKRDDKICLSHCANAITRLQCFEDGQGIHPIVSLLKEWLARGRSLAEAVVLVRLYAQSVPVELALLGAEIPYRLEGGRDLFACEEVTALLGYLRLLAGRLGELDATELRRTLLAMLSQPHLGIRREELEDLVTRILPVIVDNQPTALALLEAGIERPLPPFIRRHFSLAAENWRWLLSQDKDESAARLLGRLVARLELYDFYHSFAARAVVGENRVKTCEALIAFARERALTVSGVIDQFEEFSARKAASGEDALLLTSIHRAKGLEWPLVVLPGLEEGSFPFYPEAGGADAEVEDERRLFYVGMTRAIEELVCIHPADVALKQAMRQGRGRLSLEGSRASRFLFESNLGVSCELGQALDERRATAAIRGEELSMARRYFEKLQVETVVSFDCCQPRVQEKEKALSRRPVAINELRQGLTVFHPSFGEGTIRTVHDRRQGRISVDFLDQKNMILLAKFARLEV